jgi:hypothetical protein
MKLKTTDHERRMNLAMAVRPSLVADLLDDVNTLLAENTRLRAAAATESSRLEAEINRSNDALRALDRMNEALLNLERALAERLDTIRYLRRMLSAKTKEFDPTINITAGLLLLERKEREVQCAGWRRRCDELLAALERAEQKEKET